LEKGIWNLFIFPKSEKVGEKARTHVLKYFFSPHYHLPILGEKVGEKK
jgi:hypothetical protein